MTEAITTPPATDAPDPPKKKGSMIRFLAGLLLFAWVLRSFIVAPFSIPSGSMLPTMLIGDYLGVAKWPYGYSRFSFPMQIPNFEGRVLASLPERGDIVVFRPPGNEDVDYVKRVIGLPGDEIQVVGGQVMLNGAFLPKERLPDFAMPISPNSPCKVVAGATAKQGRDKDGDPLCLFPAYRETLPSGRSYVTLDQVDNPEADDYGPITVPEGHLFLMGDNRDDSLDSRFAPTNLYNPGIGFVPLDNVVGRAIGNYWSTDGSAQYYLPWTWFTALRGARLGAGYGA